MGWTGTHREKGLSHLDFFREEFGSNSVVAASSVGSTVYLAYQYTRDGKPTDIGALVVLTRWERDDWHNFWYKDMSESSGPYNAKCPEQILNMLSPTNCEYSLEWRDRCRKYNEERRRS